MSYDRKKAAVAGVPEELTWTYRVNSASTFVPYNLRPLTKDEFSWLTTSRLTMLGTLERWRIKESDDGWLLSGEMKDKNIKMVIHSYNKGFVREGEYVVKLGHPDIGPGTIERILNKDPSMLPLLGDYFDIQAAHCKIMKIRSEKKNRKIVKAASKGVGKMLMNTFSHLIEEYAIRGEEVPTSLMEAVREKLRE